MSRILLLSSRGEEERPDTVVDDVVAEVFSALAELGYDVVHAAVSSASELERAVRAARPTVVFNVCESLAGETRFESAIPVVLDRLGVPYTGSSGDALRTCLHKFECNEVLRRAGVRVPLTRRVARGDDLGAFPVPAIVKPDREDGSLGIDASSVVTELSALERRVDRIVEQLGQPALVQAYIAGREISVSLLGHPEPRALPLGEIAFDDLEGAPKILTYAAKWHRDSVDFVATRPVSAAVDPSRTRRLIATARRAFHALALRDYARVDMRVDAHGEPWVIDVNPNCDLGRDGAFMRSARRAGLDRAETLSTIVRGALSRASMHEKRNGR